MLSFRDLIFVRALRTTCILMEEVSNGLSSVIHMLTKILLGFSCSKLLKSLGGFLRRAWTLSVLARTVRTFSMAWIRKRHCRRPRKQAP